MGQTSSYPSLHGFLFPAVRYYQPDATTSDVSIVPISPNEAYSCLGTNPVLDTHLKEELKIDDSLPRYAPEEIAVTEIFLRGVNSVTASVQVDGQEMFCKSRRGINGLFSTSKGQELESLDKDSQSLPETRHDTRPPGFGLHAPQRDEAHPRVPSGVASWASPERY